MKTFMNPIRFVYAVLILFASAPVFAQSCANAIPITNGGTFSGTTCSQSNQFPTLVNGAIQTPGQQVIYALSDLSAQYLNEQFTLTADPNSLSLYVCRNPCSTYASCVAAGDVGSTGSVTLNLPKPAEYFLVLGSTSGVCSTFSLTITGTFNDRP